MAEDLKNKPSYTCHAYSRMKPGWQIMADTVAGTLHLRECDSLTNGYYLPPEPAEKPEHYGYRKRRAIFFNATERTLTGLVGMVFRKEPKLGDDVPEIIRGREAKEDQAKIEGQWENIDNGGTHGSVFCKEVFTDAMRDGHAAILVDMPPALPEGSTMADEKAANRRPYWVSYKADQIINWRWSTMGGQARLELIVFKEESQEPEGEYGEKKVTRYRVLRLKMVDVETLEGGLVRQEERAVWELWKEVQGENLAVDVVFEDGGATSLSEIPVAVIYSRKRGALQSRPPLLDLALINVCHYQKYNDLSVYLHICSRPILCRKGADPNNPVTQISAYRVFDVSAPDGDVWFAETTGAALEAASNDIKDLETRMAALGLSIVEGKSKPQPESTATEEVLDHVREESDLATAARSLKDGIELCLRFHMQYLTPSAKSGGSVELGATIEEMTIPPQELQALSNMAGANQITLETLWSIMERAGKLPADFDPKKERAQVEADAQAAADRLMSAVDRAPVDPE